MREEARVKASLKPSAPLEKSEQVALVNQCLEQLKPDYREVIILREYQNLSYKEIAAVTRSTLSAVKSRLFKARVNWRLYLNRLVNGSVPGQRVRCKETGPPHYMISQGRTPYTGTGTSIRRHRHPVQRRPLRERLSGWRTAAERALCVVCAPRVVCSVPRGAGGRARFPAYAAARAFGCSSHSG
jgi:hypothetical protein